MTSRFEESQQPFFTRSPEARAEAVDEALEAQPSVSGFFTTWRRADEQGRTEG